MHKDNSHQGHLVQMGLRGKTILGLGALLLSVLLLMGLATYYQGKSLAIKKVMENIQENVAKDSTVIEHQIADARSNLMAIATTPPVQGIIRAKDNGGRDPLTGETTDIWLVRFEKIFTAFISFHPGYAYIRYIDEKGKEIIRVDLEGGKVRITPRSELETRSGYSYFKETLKLKQGEIYYSDVSPAKKNEQFVFPYKPQFRLSTPLYDDKQKVRGMIILNLYASSLFASLTPDMNGTKKYLVNQNGYFLVHPDKSKEFGFDLGFDYTIKNSHPLLAKELKIKDAFAEYHKEHIGGFHKIFFDPTNKDRYWAVLYEIPESIVLKDIYTTQNTMLLVGILITAFSITVITWYISKKIVSPIVTLAEAAKKLEGGDLSVRVQERLAEDEFQTLYHAINSFASSQQQYTEQIKRSEERFRSLVQNSSDIIALLETDGKIAYVSPSIERILAYPPEELIGKNAFELVHPEDLQKVMDTFSRMMQNVDLTVSTEFRFRHKDGSWRILEASGSNQLSNRAIGYVVINSRDITERRETEERTQVINKLLRLFAQTSSRKEYLDAVVLLLRSYSDCQNMGIRILNDQGDIPYESTVGFSREFLESEAFIPILYREEMIGAIHLTEGKEGKVPLKLIESIELLTPFIGEAIHRFSLEQEIHDNFFKESAVNMILSLSIEDIPFDEFLLKTLKMILAIPLLSSESSGSILIVGGEPEVLEMKAQDNIAEPLKKLCTWVPFGKCLCGRAALTQKIVFADHIDDRHEICYEGMSPHGHYAVPILFGGRTLGVINIYVKEDHIRNPEEGTFLRTVADTLAGIIVRKQVEGEKENLQSQLLQSQKMEAVGQLTGGIAHDFNNILTAIITYGHFLKMKLGNEDLLISYVDRILASSERAANLTQSLLAFSRKQITNPRPVNLNEIIREMGALFSRVIGENIELKPILIDEDLIIMADTKQIDQVLLNLLTNARDAMPHGGMVLLETNRVELDDLFIKTHGYGEPGEYALLSVTDTGIGMDSKIRERIFEPFFTTKEVGKGTGLGLAMVYGIMKQHNGYINVYSEPGKGTTLNIYFPLIKAMDGGTKPEPEPVHASERGTETILLAEDNPIVMESTKVLLEEFGYAVIEAVNGEDALNIYRDNKDKIDLVLLDMIMPKKNGKEVYDKIREIKPDLKVLFMSGYTANIPDKIMPHEQGLDIILKPFTKNDFLKRVRGALSQ